MPLSRLALAYARLVSGFTNSQYADATQRLFCAKTQHPELVSGTGRSDFAIMEAGKGDWIAKAGAEGVQAIGIRSAGLGIAIKIIDGNTRTMHAVIAAVLQPIVKLSRS